MEINLSSTTYKESEGHHNYVHRCNRLIVVVSLAEKYLTYYFISDLNTFAEIFHDHTFLVFKKIIYLLCVSASNRDTPSNSHVSGYAHPVSTFDVLSYLIAMAVTLPMFCEVFINLVITWP